MMALMFSLEVTVRKHLFFLCSITQNQVISSHHKSLFFCDFYFVFFALVFTYKKLQLKSCSKTGTRKLRTIALHVFKLTIITFLAVLRSFLFQ